MEFAYSLSLQARLILQGCGPDTHQPHQLTLDCRCHQLSQKADRILRQHGHTTARGLQGTVALPSQRDSAHPSQRSCASTWTKSIAIRKRNRLISRAGLTGWIAYVFPLNTRPGSHLIPPNLRQRRDKRTGMIAVYSHANFSNPYLVERKMTSDSPK